MGYSVRLKLKNNKLSTRRADPEIQAPQNPIKRNSAIIFSGEPSFRKTFKEKFISHLIDEDQ